MEFIYSSLVTQVSAVGLTLQKVETEAQRS